MKQTVLRMYLIPKDWWSEGSAFFEQAGEFLSDALAIESRLPKGVNLASERSRYQLCCQRIQEAAYSQGDDLSRELLSPEYLTLLRTLYEQSADQVIQSRVTACFFSPKDTVEHSQNFESLIKNAGLGEHPEGQKRLAFLEMAKEQEGGVIEVPELFSGMEAGSDTSEGIFLDYLSTPGLSISTAEQELTRESREKLEDIFKDKIRRALETGEEVNCSNQPHPVLAEVLNYFVYSDGIQPGLLPIIYMDGSQADPFPVGLLTRQECDLEDLPVLKASLISMRHLEMDEHVDMAWFRNSKVSQPRPFAQTDAYCTQRTSELLAGIGPEGLCLHLYQTGLETAVIGFYRALVSFFQAQREQGHSGRVKVVPHYFVSEEKGYKKGTPWV
jgi:hypothetical protein